ncbi:MAG TPA: hypothetical protein VKR55_08040 [Bradyrhizobium sp.]|uniref:hypothetical protein n=1 Tax=Bradyrhizobium sp. TaxID=376 RepID=UPI002D1B8B6A|nr:hypothetical protein [Bradyrhizobium sp.]HLZ02088.1 hypothetical protein [Bradyrhizobium sp.]
MSFCTRALSLLVASALLGSASADAATFMISPGGQAGPHISGTMTMLGGRPPCNYCGPKAPPPIPRSAASDPYDTSKNLNPGGGGGLRPGKKPNLD